MTFLLQIFKVTKKNRYSAQHSSDCAVTLDALAFKSSRLQMFYKIGVLKTFAKFMEK